MPIPINGEWPTVTRAQLADGAVTGHVVLTDAPTTRLLSRIECHGCGAQHEFDEPHRCPTRLKRWLDVPVTLAEEFRRGDREIVRVIVVSLAVCAGCLLVLKGIEALHRWWTP